MKWADNILLTAQEIDGRTLHVPNRARTTVTIVWNFGVLWRILAEKSNSIIKYTSEFSVTWLERENNIRLSEFKRVLPYTSMIETNISIQQKIINLFNIFKKKFCPFTRLKPFLILRHPVVIVMRKDVMLEIHNSRYCCFKLSKIYCGFRSLQLFD